MCANLNCVQFMIIEKCRNGRLVNEELNRSMEWIHAFNVIIAALVVRTSIWTIAQIIFAIQLSQIFVWYYKCYYLRGSDVSSGSDHSSTTRPYLQVFNLWQKFSHLVMASIESQLIKVWSICKSINWLHFLNNLTQL
jgi:hypothetical protein